LTIDNQKTAGYDHICPSTRRVPASLIIRKSGFRRLSGGPPNSKFCPSSNLKPHGSTPAPNSTNCDYARSVSTGFTNCPILWPSTTSWNWFDRCLSRNCVHARIPRLGRQHTHNIPQLPELADSRSSRSCLDSVHHYF